MPNSASFNPSADGIGISGGVNRRFYVDQVITRAWETGPAPGEVEKVCKALARPRSWVYTQAARMGLRRPKNSRPWSAEESRILRIKSSDSDDSISRALRRSGFRRTPMEVHGELARLQCARDGTNSMTSEQVADLLGMSQSTVVHWIGKGLLKSERISEQGKHYIKTADLRFFITRNPLLLNLRKIRYPEWFIALVAGR